MYEETDPRHLHERIAIKDNAEYIKKYEHIRARLKDLLGDDALYIEHVGTTAVSDISAYPVVDVAIAASTETIRDKICKKLLSQSGFTEVETRNDEILIRKGTYEKPQYYIHLALSQSIFFKSMILFRDELKLKPKKRIAYDSIHGYAKMEYEYDLEKYHYAKTSFIKATAKQNGIENYDEEIHLDKIERFNVSKATDVVEKVCGYIIYAGIAQMLVRLFAGLVIEFIYTEHTIIFICGCLALSFISTMFMLVRLLREHTNTGIVLKRIMFIVFGATLCIDAIINLVIVLNR